MFTVLIVDDEEPLLHNLATFLGAEPGEATVLTATSGEEGLAQLERHPSVSILVTDIRLPGIDGLELLRRARDLRPDLTAIVMTAFGSPEVRRESARCGAFHFLEKPLDLDEFRSAVLRAAEEGSAPGFSPGGS
jgi:DNA-binding NtrC family response regulator